MRRRTKKLELRRETIRLLEDDRLPGAAGGVKLTPQCPSWYCVPPTDACRTTDCFG